jgi:hypothetical protein
LSEDQNGFQRDRSCCDSYFTLKILIEKHRQFNIETHLAFIDFVKAFDKVIWRKLLEILAYDNEPVKLSLSVIIYIAITKLP